MHAVAQKPRTTPKPHNRPAVQRRAPGMPRYLEAGPIQRATASDARQREGQEEEEEIPMQRKLASDPQALQRQPEMSDEEEEEALQMREAGGASDPAPASSPAPEAGAGGLPRWLRGPVERMSGHDLSDVQVHRNSDKPAQVGALAFAQGSDIHLAPGQEHHLPHEAWHIVQQRDGRVPTTATANGAAINDDPSLEREADRMGRQAVKGGSTPRARPRRTGKGPNRDVAQHQTAAGVIQRTPPAFLGVAAASWELAGTVVGLATTVAGAGAATYSAVNQGDNGFGSISLPGNHVTEVDKTKLRKIVEFRIINAYVQRYLERHPDVRDQLRGIEGPPAPAAPTTTPPSAAPAAGGTALPSGAGTASQIDEAVMASVRTSIDGEIANLLEQNKYSDQTLEFKWGEDNTTGAGSGNNSSGSAESVGVTGFLRFRDMEASVLRETPTLTEDARRAVGDVPGGGEALVVHRFIGGTAGGYATWSAWDSLAVNFDPPSATPGTAANGAPKFTIRTKWYWNRWGPDSETTMRTVLEVRDDAGLNGVSTHEGVP